MLQEASQKTRDGSQFSTDPFTLTFASKSPFHLQDSVLVDKTDSPSRSGFLHHGNFPVIHIAGLRRPLGPEPNLAHTLPTTGPNASHSETKPSLGRGTLCFVLIYSNPTTKDTDLVAWRRGRQ